MQDSVSNRLRHIDASIADMATRHGRQRADITLLAVSKGQPLEAIAAARDAGQEAFGESYVNEAKLAVQAYPTLQWHFIGPIQSNKTRFVAENFAWVHSVDRTKIVERLNRQRPDPLAPLNVCLQLNIDDEPTKSGVAKDQLRPLADLIMRSDRLRFRGLMAIPRPTPTFERQRRSLAEVRRIYEQLRSEGYPLDTLSMGMSGDMEAAIAEGSTLLRVGSAIFGPRQGAGRIG